MLIVGKNLSELARHHEVCDLQLVEEFSIKIRLGRDYFRPKTDTADPVVYEVHPNPSALFTEKQTIVQNLSLAPNDCVIACSYSAYKIPLDHFGFVQTKGTLARMFVQATCNDGQIEPGFEGHITLEIVNLSPWTVELPRNSEIAQLFLIKTSTPVQLGYRGRYCGGAKTGPTLPIFV
jgi:dCTP deaminase